MEKYFVYRCFNAKEQMKELENHLSMNGYNFSINGQVLVVYEEDADYVETIMDDRNIEYILEDFEWK